MVRIARITSPSLLYGLTGILCFPAPFLRTAIGEGPDRIQLLQAFPFVFLALPLAAASFALAFSHWRRRTRGLLETVVATLWLVTVLAHTLPPIVWPPSTGLIVGQAVVVAVSSLGLAASALVLLRGDRAASSLGFRILQALGIGLIALLFARGAAGLYLSTVTTLSNGLAQTTREAQLFAAVLVTAALGIAAGAAGDRDRAASSLRNELRGAPTG